VPESPHPGTAAESEPESAANQTRITAQIGSSFPSQSAAQNGKGRAPDRRGQNHTAQLKEKLSQNMLGNRVHTLTLPRSRIANPGRLETQTVGTL
jgi:hypothetical protein